MSNVRLQRDYAPADSTRLLPIFHRCSNHCSCASNMGTPISGNPATEQDLCRTLIAKTADSSHTAANRCSQHMTETDLSAELRGARHAMHGTARTLELPRWPAISASMMSDGESLSGSPMHCRRALMLLHASPPISVNTCGRPRVQGRASFLSPPSAQTSRQPCQHMHLEFDRHSWRKGRAQTNPRRNDARFAPAHQQWGLLVTGSLCRGDPLAVGILAALITATKCVIVAAMPGGTCRATVASHRPKNA